MVSNFHIRYLVHYDAAAVSLFPIIVKMSSFSFINTLKNTLFVASKTDIASLNIASNLVRNFEWKPIQSHRNEIKSIQTLLGNTVYLWLINEPLLHLNDIPNLFSSDISSIHEECAQLTDIIFLSRHAASSGTLSLTVHPIGIPWMVDSSTVGGIPGKCSPPNPRISSLYRSLLREVKLHDVGSKYQVSLEATHHGPYVGLPACFVEIGSTEREWGDDEAGLIWSQCLAKEFKFPPPNISSTSTIASSSTTSAPITVDQEDLSLEELDNDGKNNVVVISIGGGHYVPKMNDLVISYYFKRKYIKLNKKLLL